jgi:hypothetical protein
MFSELRRIIICDSLLSSPPQEAGHSASILVKKGQGAPGGVGGGSPFDEKSFIALSGETFSKMPGDRLLLYN